MSDLLITNARLLDLAEGQAHEHSSVRIEGQRIVEVAHGGPLHPGRQPGHLTGAKPPRAAAQ